MVSCHSSIAVKRAWLRQLLQKKIFNWEFAYSFRGLVHYHHVGDHGSMQAWCWRNSWESYILICKHRRKREPGPGMSFWNLKAHFQQHTSSIKATPPSPSLMSQWGPFLFKPPYIGKLRITFYTKKIKYTSVFLFSFGQERWSLFIIKVDLLKSSMNILSATELHT